MKNAYIPLSRLMSTKRAHPDPVAWAAEALYSWADFQGHVAGLQTQLAKEPKGRWLLSGRSSYAFGVGLMALWESGRTAVLPSNAQPENILTAAQGVRGLISDSALSYKNLKTFSPLKISHAPRLAAPLSLETPVLELFTSGSTGEQKRIQKTIGNLEAEIAILEKTFGPRMGQADVLSTVSHQHIYGLLFRLLWPLCAGRPFAAETALLWDSRSVRRGASASVLVTSPAHLERTEAFAPSMLGQRLIFSSGGALSESVARWVRRKAGQAPIEVLGSTETGGVAWRQQNSKPASTAWKPLPGVRLSIVSRMDPRLSVASAFVSAPQGRWIMGDYVQLSKNGTFQLKGRADRIVKMAEKRVSLDAMEKDLGAHAWIKSVRLLLLDSRPSLGAAIVLTPLAERVLADKGRLALINALRERLHGRFEASTHPRFFRFVKALPQDAQGKVTTVLLRPLFASKEDKAVTDPQLLNRHRRASRLICDFQVPKDLFYLRGHFPRYAIVPGVTQISWVVKTAADWMKRPVLVKGMEGVKFKSPLHPEQKFRLVLEKAPALLRFSLTQGDTLFSEGRLLLR